MKKQISQSIYLISRWLYVLCAVSVVSCQHTVTDRSSTHSIFSIDNLCGSLTKEMLHYERTYKFRGWVQFRNETYIRPTECLTNKLLFIWDYDTAINGDEYFKAMLNTAGLPRAVRGVETEFIASAIWDDELNSVVLRVREFREPHALSIEQRNLQNW